MLFLEDPGKSNGKLVTNIIALNEVARPKSSFKALLFLLFTKHKHLENAGGKTFVLKTKPIRSDVYFKM